MAKRKLFLEPLTSLDETSITDPTIPDALHLVVDIICSNVGEEDYLSLEVT
jgi:hypothetical protein